MWRNIEYLPKYSPDLNRTELSFSNSTAICENVPQQTIPTLHRRVAAFIPTLSSAECRNYFRHAGYVSI
jgi:transposase